MDEVKAVETRAFVDLKESIGKALSFNGNKIILAYIDKSFENQYN